MTKNAFKHLQTKIISEVPSSERLQLYILSTLLRMSRGSNEYYNCSQVVFKAGVFYQVSFTAVSVEEQVKTLLCRSFLEENSFHWLRLTTQGKIAIETIHHMNPVLFVGLKKCTNNRNMVV
ncbi:MAG: hypothetical protein RLZZ308_252 [Candidatus Parcubacteria bacterium]|jgi:hypothetical protein